MALALLARQMAICMRPGPRVLVCLVLALLTCAPSPAQAQSVVWNANSESDLAGYKVHYGTASRNYTTIVDVGKTTTSGLFFSTVNPSHS